MNGLSARFYDKSLKWNLSSFRFFFIVLTDVCCWSPIIVLKFLVFYDMEISSDVYLWLIIFVLPLNSALNPFLYTFTTPKYRDQIFAAFVKPNLKKHEISSNQITADESQTKVSLLYNSNGSISKWKIFSKWITRKVCIFLKVFYLQIEFTCYTRTYCQ